MGYLPGTIGIVIGVIFAGAVQDYGHAVSIDAWDGESLGRMAREEDRPVGAMRRFLAVFAIMMILLAVLALVVVNRWRPRGGHVPTRHDSSDCPVHGPYCAGSARAGG